MEDEDVDVLITSAPQPTASTSKAVPSPSEAQPQASSSGFAPLPASAQNTVLKNDFRRIPIPPHRMSPLKRDWVNLYTPMVEMLGLQVRMNVKRRAVELKVSLNMTTSVLSRGGERSIVLTEFHRRHHIRSTLVRFRKEQTSSRLLHWDSTSM